MTKSTLEMDDSIRLSQEEAAYLLKKARYLDAFMNRIIRSSPFQSSRTLGELREAKISLLARSGPGMLSGQDMNSYFNKRGYAKSGGDAVRELLAKDPPDLAAAAAKVEEFANINAKVAHLQSPRLANAQVALHENGNGKIPTDAGELRAFIVEKFFGAMEARIRREGYEADWHSSPDAMRAVLDTTLKDLDKGLAAEGRKASGLKEDQGFKDDMFAHGVAHLLGRKTLGEEQLRAAHPDDFESARVQDETGKTVEDPAKVGSAYTVAAVNQMRATFGQEIAEKAKEYL